MFETRKIDNEGADPNLTSKLRAAKLPIAKSAPQDSLHVGLIAAEIAGTE